MKKTVIVINGKGASGKDTLCNFAAKKYQCKNVSSITPIKEIAQQGGWNGQKDKKSRKFLADLKQIFIEYNDLPLKYLLEEYDAFLKGSQEIMFVHIREPQEIEKFKQQTAQHCITLLIKGRKDNQAFGNASDDGVEQYEYDYIYENIRPLQEAEEDFLRFLDSILIG